MVENPIIALINLATISISCWRIGTFRQPGKLTNKMAMKLLRVLRSEGRSFMAIINHLCLLHWPYRTASQGDQHSSLPLLRANAHKVYLNYHQLRIYHKPPQELFFWRQKMYPNCMYKTMLTNCMSFISFTGMLLWMFAFLITIHYFAIF